MNKKNFQTSSSENNEETKSTKSKQGLIKNRLFIGSILILISAIIYYYKKINMKLTKINQETYNSNDDNFTYADEGNDHFPDDYISKNIVNPRIIEINKYPEVLMVENLLSEDECNFIIEKASHTIGKASPFQNRDSAYDPKFFSGSNTFLNKGVYPLVTEIEKRISKVIGEPIDHLEV